MGRECRVASEYLIRFAPHKYGCISSNQIRGIMLNSLPGNVDIHFWNISFFLYLVVGCFQGEDRGTNSAYAVFNIPTKIHFFLDLDHHTTASKITLLYMCRYLL